MPHSLWLAIVGVVIGGFLVSLDNGPNARSLNYRVGNSWSGERFVGRTHRFDVLRTQLTTPDGWTYLSVKDDAIVPSATFVHLEDQVVIQLLRWKPKWFSEDSQIKNTNGERVQWFVEPSRSEIQSESLTPASSVSREVKRVGRLVNGQVEPMWVVMIDAQVRPVVPPSVDRLFAAIKPLTPQRDEDEETEGDRGFPRSG